MNGLQEIRGLFAARYFNEPSFVQTMHLVVTVVERPPFPTPEGRIYPETYFFCVEAEIQGRRWDYTQDIDKADFERCKCKPHLVNEVWVGMVKALLEAKEEADAVLSG